MYVVCLHTAEDISGVWMRGLDRLLQCRTAAAAPPAERPRLLQQMFKKQHPLNDVWEYRSPPAL